MAETTGATAQKQGVWSEDDGITVSPFEGVAACEGNTPGPHLRGAEWRVSVQVTDDGESWVVCRDCALATVAENMTMLTNMRDGVHA